MFVRANELEKSRALGSHTENRQERKIQSIANKGRATVTQLQEV